MAKQIKYNKDIKNEYIFNDLDIETFSNDLNPQFGRNSSVLCRKYIINKYLSTYPNFEHFLQNGSRLYFVCANLQSPIRNNELSWENFLGEENINNYKNDIIKIYDQSRYINHIPLGFCLLVKNTCKLTSIEYTSLEFIDSFYKGKNIAQLIIDRLIENDTLDCWFPTDVSIAEKYWIKKEKETHQIGEMLSIYVYDGGYSKEQLYEFIKKNYFCWPEKLIKLLLKINL